MKIGARSSLRSWQWAPTNSAPPPISHGSRSRHRRETSMKDDLGKEGRSGSSWPANGPGARQAAARCSLRSPETQPWAVRDSRGSKIRRRRCRRSLPAASPARKTRVEGSSSARGRRELSAGAVANALENNFRLYTIVKRQAQHDRVGESLSLHCGEWHRITLSVCPGDPRSRRTWTTPSSSTTSRRLSRAAGFGLWTKADSVTEFADLEVTGTPAK